ncbi:PROBABLE CONSERVED INTEGRAL MEMBRANE PROTEIN [Microbacterium esteraromaticum]|uniref:PROBABLE CONSERVED INTEGRAL MEMBRANE PROTEIN n=1 Tax=Microbacterium esteraromaticum TaxID=57043 RepID=A0A1R4KFE5_9MICO|nr:vitamin K epoxide reductase family protein [Microbacterium esteraromaticum]SJN43019.1 PROBABLE CONSERVED INTEGRAL MEMBRANE PROTEIN [Microbacterium esteraromaticum]
MTAQRTRYTGYGIWLIVASLVGWWAAFQLTVEKFFLLENPSGQTSCYVSVMIQCDKNLSSWQGSVFGFSNPIIGLTAWMAVLVMGVAVLAAVRFPRWFWGLFGLGVAGAFAFVCWLIFQSIYMLAVLCPWCMATWAVTIPTFLATAVHLVRNGTLTRSQKARQRADRLMVWVPLATIVVYAIVIAMAQLAGLDLLGEVAGMLF